jgi:hypothetical protein
MRITAKSAGPERVIELETPATIRQRVRPRRHLPAEGSDRSQRHRPRRLVPLSLVVVAAIAGLTILIALETSGMRSGSQPTSRPSSTSAAPSPTDSTSPSPTQVESTNASPTRTGSASASATLTSSTLPSPTETDSASGRVTPSASPPAPGGSARTGLSGSKYLFLLVLVPFTIVCVTLLRREIRTQRHMGSRKRPPQFPVRLQRKGHGASATDDHPKASLGTPVVLVLTTATTDDDRRLRDQIAQETGAIFANLQLACSFHPSAAWSFGSARLTVVLGRADGRAAPAPIAYSLRPLSERDGAGRENTVDIGADLKFVSAKLGEKSTRGGEVFVRGYGLQESTSYWQFTPTRDHPLEGSYWLWLIAKAPLETDMAVTSSLSVQVSPRRRWSRTGTPLVEGIGMVGLVLRLKDGPPYRPDTVDESELRQHP